MKFGKTIIERAQKDQSWGRHFINFNALKKLISVILASLESAGTDKKVEWSFVQYKLRDPKFYSNLAYELSQISSEVTSISSVSEARDDASKNFGSVRAWRDAALSRSRRDRKFPPKTSNLASTTESKCPTHCEITPDLLKSYFFFKLDMELARVNEFCEEQRQKLAKMVGELRNIVESVNTKATNIINAGDDESNTLRRRNLMTKQKSLSDFIHKLQDFIDFTYLIFFKVLKKFDKKTNSSELSKYMHRVENSSFFTYNIGTNISLLSEVQNSLEILRKSKSRHKLWDSIQDAALLGAHAVNDVNPDALDRQDVLETAKISLADRLTDLENDLRKCTGYDDLTKQITTFKARIFNSFILDVMTAADLSVCFFFRS